VHAGNISDGTDILGYRVSGRSWQPNRASCAKLLAKLDKIVDDAKRTMKASTEGPPAAHSLRYHQAVVALHETIWGWSQSFKYTTAQHAFAGLDLDIEKRVAALRRAVHEPGAEGDYKLKRRIGGIHLLADTSMASLADLRSDQPSQTKDVFSGGKAGTSRIKNRRG
jgi:RNA-directed DNA polymerase